jgi:hypothetical protein
VPLPKTTAFADIVAAPVPPADTGKVPVAKTEDDVAYTAPPEVNEVKLVPPFAVGSVPVTPVVNGSPVAFVSVPDAGVPRAGVTKVAEVIVGDVPNTKAPEPVSPVTAAAKLAEDGVPKNVATPVPKEERPVPPEPAGSGFVKVTACAELIAIAVVPLVWIAIAPVVSVVTFSAVAVVVPALSVVAILSS